MLKKLSKTIRTLESQRWLFYVAGGLMLLGIIALQIFFYRPWNMFALCFIPLAFIVIIGYRILGLLVGAGYYSKELAETEELLAKREEVDEYLRVNYPEDYAEEDAAESE
jgi:hypothetical protein